MSTTTARRPRLVTDAAALEALIDEIAGQDAYAFDTEFHLERTYYAQLALIQLGWAGQVALVDPLAVDPGPLGRLFAGPGVAVGHAADQDLDVLDAAVGVVPTTVFDTQIAAGFLGMSSPSLSRLVEQVLGVNLPKADRLSDWIKRPLSERQITYAANDVAYLLEVRAVMSAQLAERGRLQWAEEECAEVLSTRRRPTVPEEAWWRMGDIRNLRGKSRGVAQEVAAWRERKAAATDRPRRTILSDLALLAIAQRPPRDRSELQSMRGVDGRHLAKGGADEILAAVRRGQNLASAEIRLPPEGGDVAAPAVAVAVAAGLVRQIADDLEFDPGLLATRADITRMLRGMPGRLDHGWRRDLAGEPIARLASGQVAAAFAEDGSLVLEERSYRPVPLPQLRQDPGDHSGAGSRS